MLRHGRHHLVFMITCCISKFMKWALHLTEIKFKCLLFITKVLALAISPNLGGMNLLNIFKNADPILCFRI